MVLINGLYQVVTRLYYVVLLTRNSGIRPSLFVSKVAVVRIRYICFRFLGKVFYVILTAGFVKLYYVVLTRVFTYGLIIFITHIDESFLVNMFFSFSDINPLHSGKTFLHALFGPFVRV